MQIEWISTLDNIFAALIIGGLEVDSPLLPAKREVFKQCLPKFKGKFKKNIFEDEYAILYEIINTWNIGIFDAQQINVIIDNNRDVILDSSVIDFDSMLSTISGLAERASEVDKCEVLKAMVLDKFEMLSNKVVDMDTFNSNCQIYTQLYTQHLGQEMVNNMSLILNGGCSIKSFKGRNITYKGIAGLKQYYQEVITVIDELESPELKSSLVIDEAWLQEELQKKVGEDELKLMTFGLDEIDDSYKYLRRTHMLGILGPPKGGKTRTSAYLAARALTLGFNVAIWPLEGHESEWNGMIIANIIKMTSGIEIASADIITNTYDREYQQLVVHAKTLLATGSARGKLSYIKGTAYVENFLDVLKGHYENDNAFDVIIVDSMVHMMSLKGKPKSERISEAYELLKTFISFSLPVPALAILPAQLKQDAVDWLRQNPNETIDVTAGGESAATVRSPDYVIGVFSTKQERNAGMMKFYAVASRHNGTFDDFYAKCALGCCYYESDPKLNTAS